jgi:hypothetical protein
VDAISMLSGIKPCVAPASSVTGNGVRCEERMAPQQHKQCWIHRQCKNTHIRVVRMGQEGIVESFLRIIDLHCGLGELDGARTTGSDHVPWDRLIVKRRAPAELIAYILFIVTFHVYVSNVSVFDTDDKSEGRYKRENNHRNQEW